MSRQMKHPEPLESFDALFFKLPLYAEVALSSDQITALFDSTTSLRIDGYCPDCSRSSTFSAPTFAPRSLYGDEYEGHLGIVASCTRDSAHAVRAYLRFNRGLVQKTGQHPALKDLSDADLRPYKSVLPRESFSELNRAVGLASHGVGVGALVYLRRIFERLIHARFEDHKGDKGWKVEDFDRLRMGEKITLLKDYLPSFLVEHASIYGILSQGIHELDEEQCKTLFPILKDSLLMILDEDKLAKERAAKRLELKRLLATAGPQKGGG